jgi:nucleoside phosphorylase
MSKRNGEVGEEESTSRETKRRKTDHNSHLTEFTHNDYTVGWVCALPKEQTAATAMLDQRHADLPKPLNDYNTYTLGSIGKYNIVIACLPKGKLGTSSAATVATQMVRTFPSIKIGLMVGIGGGIPPKVRLGDVVVSTPVGQFPGVVQWDFGKAKQGGNFERTGSLNGATEQRAELGDDWKPRPLQAAQERGTTTLAGQKPLHELEVQGRMPVELDNNYHSDSGTNQKIQQKQQPLGTIFTISNCLT